jgi:hypothetical protein
MIVSDLHVAGVAFCPRKADAPLIVGSYAPLTRPVGPELFKPIAWWFPEISDIPCVLNHEKLPQCYPLNAHWITCYTFLLPNPLCILVLKGSNHCYK